MVGREWKRKSGKHGPIYNTAFANSIHAQGYIGIGIVGLDFGVD